MGLFDISEEKKRAKRIRKEGKQLRKALKNDRILTAYLAEDADPAVTEPLEALCKAQAVAVVWVKTMAELGRACGIDVGAAAAATVKPI